MVFSCRFTRYQENSPLENSHPGNFHPSNSPWRIPPRKIPTQKIPTRNIPTHVFKHFVFSLLSPFSLILLKSCFAFLSFKNAEDALVMHICYLWTRNQLHLSRGIPHLSYNFILFQEVGKQEGTNFFRVKFAQ